MSTPTPTNRSYLAHTRIVSTIDNSTVWESDVTIIAPNMRAVPELVRKHLEDNVTEWDERIHPSMAIDYIERQEDSPAPDDEWDRQMIADQERLGKEEFLRRLEGGGKQG